MRKDPENREVQEAVVDSRRYRRSAPTARKIKRYDQQREAENKNDTALAVVARKKETAQEIVQRVWVDGGGQGLTPADKEFAMLNRTILSIALRSNGFDPLKAYADCLDYSYKKGTDDNFNETEPGTALSCRKHVTDSISDLAGVKDKKEGSQKAPTVNLHFHESFNRNGDGTRTVGVAICTAPETGSGD